MDSLLKFGLSINDVDYINRKYDKSIISSIVYNFENVELIVEYFKSKGLNIKSLLINRLDVFLIDVDIIKGKLSKYENTNLFELLNNDFSIFDNLVF